jgi:hypothetical protein
MRELTHVDLHSAWLKSRWGYFSQFVWGWANLDGRRAIFPKSWGSKFMHSLTCKVLKLHFSIRCGIYNLFPSSVSPSIHHAHPSSGSSNHNSDPTVGSRGKSGDRSHPGLSNHTRERDAKLLTKTLRQWVYGSSHL